MSGIVIIPAYNPDRRLIELVDDLWELGYRTVVVNDGSDRECDEIFEEISDVTDVLVHEKNQGKGAAIKTALRYLRSCNLPKETIIATMDADGQHDPIDVQNVITYAHTTRGEALVLGVRRIGRGMPVRSRIGNRMTRGIFHIVTGKKLSDTQTGLRAFGISLLDFMSGIEGEHYEYESNVLLEAVKSNITVKEVPIRTIYTDGKNTSSHFHVLLDSIRIYKDIIKFALCSASSFLLDFVLFTLFTFLFPGEEKYVLVANITARIISAAFNYYMNTAKVFQQKSTSKNAAQYFALAAGILFANNIVLSVYMEMEIPKYIAKILTELSLFFISFWIQRRFIYKKENKQICFEKNL